MLQVGKCKNKPVYEELNKLIFEYLELNGLEKTTEQFSKECQTKLLPCPNIPDDPEIRCAFTHYDASKMIQAFEKGQLCIFMQYWRMFLTHIQVTSDDMKKLEVYLRVHFALWPRAHGESEAAQAEAMAALKTFFDEHSPTLAKDPAILPLFALPFVSDPVTHPIYKDLVQESWTQKLRVQLDSTMHKYFELMQINICHHSRLAELIFKGEKYEGSVEVEKESNSLQVAYHQERFYQLLTNHRKIRKLLQGTRESYAKLLMVASELVGSLEQAGEKVPLEPVLEKCSFIFPELFSSKLTPDKQGKPDLGYFKRLTTLATFDPTQDSEVSLFFLGISDLSPESINYSRVKESLTSESLAPTEKLCLLQALRWMITKTNEKCRQSALDSFVAKDLLGICSKKSEYRQNLFQCMLSPNPTYLKECFARLLNAFSSTRTGRNYLAITNFTVDILVRSLSTFSGVNESFICQMVIATLQKLSLKKGMRLYMIQNNVINWLIVYIKSELASECARQNENPASDAQNSNAAINPAEDNTGFNPYLMEYGWALLMNLCLHEEAWESCAVNGTDILNSATTMLVTMPRKEVQNLAPYVVSTLFSLLRSPEMFSLAKHMQIEKSLAPLLSSDSDVAAHLNHLVSLLYARGQDRITSSRETNYDDDENPDPDVFEPELELPESWTNALNENSYTGDDLLLRNYLMHMEEPVVLPTFQDSQQKKFKESAGVIVRPVTPAKPNSDKNNAAKKRRVSRKTSVAIVVDSKTSKPKVVTGSATSTKKAASKVVINSNAKDNKTATEEDVDDYSDSLPIKKAPLAKNKTEAKAKSPKVGDSVSMDPGFPIQIESPRSKKTAQ